MTITLLRCMRRSYSRWIDGGLFREFAFTLAGAVIVSGIVALTLSPMMGSRLLRCRRYRPCFAGWVNRRFENVRNAYTRTLSGRCNTAPWCLWYGRLLSC